MSKRWWAFPLVVALSASLAVVLLTAFAAAIIYPGLPSLEALTDYQPKIPLRIFSADGKRIYAQRCASCHGAAGRGDGPNAKGLDPPPIAFTDVARAKKAKILSVCNVIDSSIPRKSNGVLYTHAGPEISVASTKVEGCFITKAPTATKNSTITGSSSNATGHGSAGAGSNST